MIDEERAIEAADWIIKNTKPYAEAKSEKAIKEEYLKVVRSEIQLATQGTVAHKEATALASPEYKDAINKYGEAVRKLAYLEMATKAAETTIELYRSLNANLRGLK